MKEANIFSCSNLWSKVHDFSDPTSIAKNWSIQDEAKCNDFVKRVENINYAKPSDNVNTPSRKDVPTNALLSMHKSPVSQASTPYGYLQLALFQLSLCLAGLQTRWRQHIPENYRTKWNKFVEEKMRLTIPAFPQHWMNCFHSFQSGVSELVGKVFPTDPSA